MKVSFSQILALATLVTCAAAQNVVITNDDGWAVAQLREEYNELRAAGFEVILSAPAENKSGSARMTTEPTPLDEPCQFNTCPTGSPAIGTDPNDPNIHYVNAFPVDAVRVGIQEFAQARFGGKPDFVISGSNIGNNLGNVVLESGTVGAACEAAKEGVPSFAFSGASGSTVSFTTLTNTNAQSTIAAKIYTSLIRKFLSTYLSGRTSPPVPRGTTLNINFSPTSSCGDNADNYKWVATRLLNSTAGVDTGRCGTHNLPDETTVSKSGCFATVSVMNATTEMDASATEQKAVFDELNSLLTCL